MKAYKAIVISIGALAFGTASAGPEKIKFPSDYLKGTLYATVDRPDTKQYRELYASPGVVESVRAGKGVPYGAVLTLVQWSVHQDAQGNPIKDGNGRFISTSDERIEAAARVHAGFVESSAVQPVRELTGMIESSRAFQINARMVSLQDEMLGRLVNQVPRL